MARQLKKPNTSPTTEGSMALLRLSPTIAAELAAGLRDVASVKSHYEISDAQWETLKANPTFRNMMREALEQFGGDLNAKNRITLKAEIALEDTLVVLAEIAYDKKAQSASRIDAVKTLAQLSGRNNKVAEGGGGSAGFALNIVIGGNQPVTIEGKTTNAPIELTNE